MTTNSWSKVGRTGACLLSGAVALALAACGAPETPGQEAPPPEQHGEPLAPSGGPREPAAGSPSVDYQQVRSLAPIDAAEIQVRESMPPQYAVWIQSGLPSGCAQFDTIEVRRDGYEYEISVWNLVPHPDAEVMCTMIYGMREHTVDLEGPFQSGMTYTVFINRDTSLGFTAE
jgi:hypothetical protein